MHFDYGTAILLALSFACGHGKAIAYTRHGLAVVGDQPYKLQDVEAVVDAYLLLGHEISMCPANVMGEPIRVFSLHWVDPDAGGGFTDQWGRYVGGYELNGAMYVAWSEHVWNTALAHELTHAYQRYCAGLVNMTHEGWESDVYPVLEQVKTIARKAIESQDHR